LQAKQQYNFYPFLPSVQQYDTTDINAVWSDVVNGQRYTINKDGAVSFIDRDLWILEGMHGESLTIRTSYTTPLLGPNRKSNSFIIAQPNLGTLIHNLAEMAASVQSLTPIQFGGHTCQTLTLDGGKWTMYQEDSTKKFFALNVNVTATKSILFLGQNYVRASGDPEIWKSNTILVSNIPNNETIILSLTPTQTCTNTSACTFAPPAEIRSGTTVYATFDGTTLKIGPSKAVITTTGVVPIGGGSGGDDGGGGMLLIGGGLIAVLAIAIYFMSRGPSEKKDDKRKRKKQRSHVDSTL
jgi:hypothetical protein